jgi:hypothetical protein
MGQTISERLKYLRKTSEGTLGEPDASKGCTSRFGGEGLVLLDNQDLASYPTSGARGRAGEVEGLE